MNLSNIDNEYDKALEWLFRQLPMFSRIGQAAYKPGLDTVYAIDNALGNPHRKFRAIHVAGTNGKGSVSHSLASVLQAAGYRTALYTSPHLVDFRERMRINGEMIPKEKVIEFVEQWRNSNSDLSPSFFELTMMMAFRWFADEEVDVAVIEVGMGGRLDSTNIITPDACVITNISADHTQFLGDTLEKIAGEKAGIIKPGIPVTIGEAAGSIRKVFEAKAAEKEAPIFFAQDSKYKDIKIENIPEGGLSFEIEQGKPMRFDLSGDYQKANLVTVLSTIDMLKEFYNVSDEAVREGLDTVCGSTGLMGRWMKIGESPLTICDTGHNEAGISYNVNQLKRLMAQSPADATLRIVLGFVADKNIDKILPLFPKEATYYFCNADIPRALPVEKLVPLAHAAGLKGEEYKSVKKAYQAAKKDSSPHDIIFVGGSTFIVADLLS